MFAKRYVRIAGPPTHENAPRDAGAFLDGYIKDERLEDGITQGKIVAYEYIFNRFTNLEMDV
ncbi:hypothetical protein ACEWPM_005860 [Roseovarius sp. S4756]|uniref:hypothetical protein n=1 Tax=Roseovarius maritimus TaxID=3342637 RepID=UPI0037285AB0